MQFVAKKHIVGFNVCPVPWFASKKATEAFSQLVKKSRAYLEYGSGGSTIFASQYVDLLVTVEGDPVFKKCVERELAKIPHRAEIVFLRPNIGITREYSWPVFAKITKSRVSRWKQYSRAPWEFFETRQIRPQLILIDGRFRSACALESLLHITEEANILIDDYFGRDYRIIEDFANLADRYDRLAHFKKKSDFNHEKCIAALRKAYVDIA